MSKEETIEETKGKSHNEQRTRLMEYKNFDLKKFKMEKKGVDVTHHENGNDAGVIMKVGETIPHPDLQKTMNLLKPLMAKRLGLLEGTDLARHHLKSDLDKLKDVLDLEKLIISRCNVNGLAFTGTGDKFGVMITGSVLVPESGSVGMAVPKITFGSDLLGYEAEAEEICEEIKQEVFNYRFLNKKAQLDLEFEASKADEEEAKKEKGKGKGKKEELI